MDQSLFIDISQVMDAAIGSGLFVSLCTIQQPDGALDAGGAPSGTYVDVPGLVNIPCMSAPSSVGKISAQEQKSITEILATNYRHVLLAGYYGNVAITGTNGVTYYGPQPNMRAVIDGTTFDILGSESDSQQTQTRMEVRQASI